MSVTSSTVTGAGKGEGKMGVWGCRMGGTSEGLEAKKKEEKKERVTKELEKEEENNKNFYNV